MLEFLVDSVFLENEFKRADLTVLFILSQNMIYQKIMKEGEIW